MSAPAAGWKKTTPGQKSLMESGFVISACPGWRNKMQVKNFTPHPVNIIRGETSTTFISEGVARVETVTTPCASIAGIKTIKTKFLAPAGLPDQKEGVFLIVSQIVKSACKNRSDLLVPAEIVRDGNGVILGCRSLSR